MSSKTIVVCLKSFLFMLIVVIFTMDTFGYEKFSRGLIEKKNSTEEQEWKTSRFEIEFNDSWTGKDKADHFIVSAFMTVGSFYLLYEDKGIKQNKASDISAYFVLSIGLIKEIHDGFKTNHVCSLNDLIADLLGIGAAVLLYNSAK